MKYIDKQQVTIFLLGAMILIGFGVFLYAPIVRKKLALKSQMARQSLSMEQIQAYSRRLPELEMQKRTLQQQVQTHAGKIPEGKEFAHLWHRIAEAMNACNLQNQLVQPETEKSFEELNCVPMKIECTGSLEQVFSFFRSIM